MKIAHRYTIHRLPACSDHKGNAYPERFGVSLTLLGNPIRVDGGEYLTREEAVAAGEAATSFAAAPPSPTPKGRMDE